MAFEPRHSGATETRQMVQRSRTESGANVSTRKFFIGLAAVVVGLAAFALWLYY